MIEIKNDSSKNDGTREGMLSMYRFYVENENIKGHLTWIFYDHRGRTTIDFTEKVTVKKFFLRPFAGRYLRKQQLSYVSDLKKKTETYVEKDN